MSNLFDYVHQLHVGIELFITEFGLYIRLFYDNFLDEDNNNDTLFLLYKG